LELSALARELRRIAERGGGFGSDVESGLRALADALEARPELDVTKLKAVLKPKRKKAPASAKFDGPASGTIASYVEQLRSVTGVPEGLSILSAILGDRAVKRPELFEIAGRFVGAKIAFKNRGEAEQAIRDRLTRKDWDKQALEVIAHRRHP